MKSIRQTNIFDKLLTLSKSDGAFRMDDFCQVEGITIAEMRTRLENNSQHFKAIGQALDYIFDNAKKAWKLGKITREEYEQLLKAEHGFEDPEHIIIDTEDYELMSGYDSEDIEKQLTSAIQAISVYGSS